MKIEFLATDCWDPAPGNDASGILVDRRLLIDTGYYCAQNLKRTGIKPQDIEQVLFTHLHHDHYMALPQMIFYYLQTGKPLSKLNIYGARADVARVVRLSMDFLQAGSGKPFYNGCELPTVHELEPGDVFTAVGETEGELEIELGEAFHAVDCLCARITGGRSGRRLGVTGDTFYCEGIVKTLAGCDLLVHETALADSAVDYDAPPSCRHSSIYAALRTASETGAKRLAVIHFAASRAGAVLERAKESGIEVFYPELLREYDV